MRVEKFNENNGLCRSLIRDADERHLLYSWVLQKIKMGF